MKRILYLHGLGSSNESNTCKELKKENIILIAPTYRPQFYKESIDLLEKIIQKENIDYIVGTSMGGYYALKLNEKYNIDTLIINPCFEPNVMLKKYINKEKAYDYANNKVIDFNETMLEEFEKVIVKNKNIHQIIGNNDKRIPPRFQKLFAKENNIKYTLNNWGHRVENIEELMKYINRY